MIVEKIFYAVVCDNCKTVCGDGDGEYKYWNEAADAQYIAQESGWEIASEPDTGESRIFKHYCEDCYSWDDNDELLIDKSRFKP